MKSSVFLVALVAAALWPASTPIPASAQEVSAKCVPSRPTDGRASPYASASVSLEGGEAVICYSRPSAREREIFGGLVPLDRFWRTGANEPTILHVDFPADVSGIAVDPGSYSFYTRPGAEEWQVYLNTSVDRWGIPINDEVRTSEVGEGTVAVETLDEHVEMFTIRFEETGPASAHLIMEWERTRVQVPISVRD
jgi:hypothetical protein